jgi:hypothetical protein
MPHVTTKTLVTPMTPLIVKGMRPLLYISYSLFCTIRINKSPNLINSTRIVADGIGKASDCDSNKRG